MKLYVDMLLITVIVVYIVDLSGFTESWRDALARMLHVKSLRPLKPFDCGKCMTWWTCIIYAIVTSNFTIPVVAFSALVSFLSIPVGQILMLIRETITKITNTLFDKL